MLHPAYLLFIVLAVTLALFIWGRWRYDVVAILALITAVVIGLISPARAFDGFSNPAVITVACVMIITQAIMQTGIIDHAVKKITPIASHIIIHLGVLLILTATLSAFMNNVGALALMMPIAMQTAIKNNVSPALILMPLAFASVLGGMTTVIGTPPNLLISAYREEITGHAFSMFDFSPVGLIVATAAITFIVLIGWRLLPGNRKPNRPIADLFQMNDYITEVRVVADSNFTGKTRQAIEKKYPGDYSILGLIRGKAKHFTIAASEIFCDKDILIIEAAHDDLQRLVRDGKLELVGGSGKITEDLRDEDISLVEAVVPQSARVEGRSWQQMRIRSRLRVNLLAIARQGKTFKSRLNHVSLRAGDVLLLQGEDATLLENVTNIGLLPLAERGVQVGMPRQAVLPILLFAIGIILAALQIFPVQIAFAIVVLLITLLNIVPARNLYSNIDWSIIVLLAAMIPLGTALQTTGGTELIANFALNIAAETSPVIILAMILIITMTLSDVMNNAATAVVMAPIAVTIAQSLNANIDPFLMAVAIGASCSFLTPISHQNNTLVMGPGGYKFQDFIRLGLPVEIIVLLVGIPALLWIWPI